MSNTEQHPLVKEFIALGEKYTQEIEQLAAENARLQEQYLDLLTYHATRDEESLPSDVVRRLSVAKESPVRVYREHRGLSQTALAKASGLSQTIISGIEAGNRRGTVDNFKALAAALDVDIDDLV